MKLIASSQMNCWQGYVRSTCQVVLFFSFLLIGASVKAQTAPEPLADFDIRIDRLNATEGRQNIKALQLNYQDQLEQNFQGLKIDWNVITGSPKMIRNPKQFLSVPSVGNPTELALNYVQNNLALFGVSQNDLSELKLSRDVQLSVNKLRQVVYQQAYRGIDLYGGELRVNLSNRNEVINCGSDMLSNIASAVNRKRPKLKMEDAIQRAAANVEINLPSPLQKKSGPEGAMQKTVFDGGGVLMDDLRIQLNYLAMSSGEARLVWRIIIGGAEAGYLYQLLLDAENGEVIARVSLTHSCFAPPSWLVFTSDSPAPFTPGPATADGTQGAFVSQVSVETNGDPTASPAGWIPAAGTTTTGNNADAFLDQNNDGTPDVARPTSAAQIFNFRYDPTLSATSAENQRAAVVNAFYWTNVYHDLMYGFGFTEAAGNFQDDNFGNGGAGGDAIRVRVQSGLNNSTFSTPPDGAPGIWRAFLFDGPDPDRDAAVDNEIGIHELTHGLTNRLVGGPAVGMSGLQAVGMGEGWSDFYALTILSEAGDDPSGNYGIGGYSLFNWFVETPGWDDNYYFGIRRYPYSTNMSRSPMTYADIDPAQFGDASGAPTAQWLVGGSPAAVHQIGEVWCASLWECRANIIDAYGFNTGNDLILQLVTTGLMLIPNNAPTLIEARDAILQADMLLTGGDNQCLLWQGFAKRGLGPDATTPDFFTTSGVVEDFYTPMTIDNVAITPLVCPGDCDGAIRVSFSGGRAPFDISWIHGPVGLTLNNICAGDYTMVITDDLGCSVARTINLPDGVDNTPPVISCPADIVVTCDTSTVETGVATVIDNCDPSPVLTYEDSNFAGDGEWFLQFERTWTATDASGNQSTCVQNIEKNTTPLIAQALGSDVDGDGTPDPFIMGTTSTTLTIPPASAACVLEWLPNKGGQARGLRRGNQTVAADCSPGNNPIDGEGKLSNPLMREVLKLGIILRLDPDFGNTPISSLSCSLKPIVLQTLRDDDTVNDLYRVANFALGNLALVPHLSELTEDLACINADLDICEAAENLP